MYILVAYTLSVAIKPISLELRSTERSLLYFLSTNKEIYTRLHQPVYYSPC